MFISLHCNHSDNANARGIEVYVGKTESPYTRESIWLAFQLQTAFEEKLSFESRGVKFANFQVLRETVNYFSSMLLEMGFLSNKNEGSYVSDYINIKRIASTVLLSIKKSIKL
ncbi:MAG: N-acetylmuramoyl-L-alanine amidase family protein [Psychroflexus halocasei]